MGERVTAKPLCSCHGQPMYRNGDAWRCLVKRQTSNARYKASSKGRATSAAYFWRKYGTSKDEVFRTYDEQGGLCACCGRSIPRPPNPQANVDHCHATGVFRGVICRKCNLALGYEEQIGELVRAYLERNRLHRLARPHLRVNP